MIKVPNFLKISSITAVCYLIYLHQNWPATGTAPTKMKINPSPSPPRKVHINPRTAPGTLFFSQIPRRGVFRIAPKLRRPGGWFEKVKVLGIQKGFGILVGHKKLMNLGGYVSWGGGWLAIKKQQFAPEELRKGPLLRKQAGSSMIPNQIHFSGANFLWKISGFYPRVYLQTFCFAYPGHPLSAPNEFVKKICLSKWRESCPIFGLNI